MKSDYWIVRCGRQKDLSFPAERLPESALSSEIWPAGIRWSDFP